MEIRTTDLAEKTTRKANEKVKKDGLLIKSRPKHIYLEPENQTVPKTKFSLGLDFFNYPSGFYILKLNQNRTDNWIRTQISIV